MSRMLELLKHAEGETTADMEPADIQLGAETNRLVASGVLLPERGDQYNDEISRLVQTIFLSGSPRSPRRLLFCGADDAQGSTVICASVGRALAARNRSACLLDAHVRGSRLSTLLGVGEKELVFPDAIPPHDRCVRISNHLWMAAPNILRDASSSLIPGGELKLLLSKLQSTFGTVLIDAPSTRSSRDAVPLGQLADAAVLVIEANSTRKIAALRAKEFLERAGVQLLGAILNDRTFPIPQAIYEIL